MDRYDLQLRLGWSLWPFYELGPLSQELDMINSWPYCESLTCP